MLKRIASESCLIVLLLALMVMIIVEALMRLRLNSYWGSKFLLFCGCCYFMGFIIKAV